MMHRLRTFRLFSLLLPLLAAAFARAQVVTVGDGHAGPYKAEHLTVELVSLQPQIAVNGTATIGLSFTIEENWHVYWINAGDSGEPPAVKWTLPAGITAGPLQFPPPQRLPLGPLMDYGYTDQVTFPITLTAAAGMKPGRVHLDAQVTWLVCSSQCLPGKGHLGFDLDVVPGPLPAPPLVGALGQAIKTLPKPLPASMSATVAGGAKAFVLTLHTGGAESDAEVYPYLDPVCDPAQKNAACDPQSVVANAADQQEETLPDGIRVRLQRDPTVTTLPKTFRALVKLSDTESYDVTADVKPGEVAAGPTSKDSEVETEATGVTLYSALGLAFLGGILLNLMPCVFPVLFLKGLALAHASGEEKRHQRAHGLVYTLGILVSFWVVVGVLLALRAGGAQFGWGFQLQSPTFVAVVASLIFFFALSLAGLFDIGLTLTGAGDSLTRKGGYAGSFFTGVLATVVATPCTAPLMGAAIGFALAQSAPAAFAIFTALAAGLALPYLALSWHPAFTRILPRPGAWMETLKQITAVPLFATAIWLAWVYASLYGSRGIDREAWLLACFLTLAIAGWVLHRWPASTGSTLAAVALVVIGLFFPLHKRDVATETWQPYSAEALASARSSGKPVFIDFTAAWCLSCKVNEAAVLDSAEVKSLFAKNNVILIKADWTQHDDVIAKELASLGRNGIPTYVLYPAGSMSNPDVLPELLTKALVVKALTKDLKQP